MIPNVADENTSRISENQLVVPALLVLAKAEAANHGPISMSQLKKALKEALDLSEEDQAPLKNRSDTKIDQVIRNLVSNKTLTKQDLVKQEAGTFSITDAGKAKLLDSFLDMMPMPDLTPETPRRNRRPGM